MNPQCRANATQAATDLLESCSREGEQAKVSIGDLHALARYALWAQERLDAIHRESAEAYYDAHGPGHAMGDD